jgi:sortase A
VLILLFAVYELVGTSIITNGRQRALAEEFRDQLASPAASPAATPKPSRPLGHPKAIARILIPKIGVDDIVVEGVKLSNLAYGPGHYPSSAKIGASGAAAVAGHRTGWGSPFINLDKIAPGDEIVLETPEATYTYRITATKVVSPTDTAVLNGDPSSKATHKLVVTTCTPKYTSRRRLILWGDLKDTVPRAK